MIAAILAGGLGTRLRPVLGGRPKSLAEIGGRSFLELLLEQLKSERIRKVVICTGYLGNQIRDRFKEKWGGLEIVISEEPEPLGTAGALRFALPFFTSDLVLVLNGDSFYRGTLSMFLDWHLCKRAAVSILLSRVPDSRRFGRVETSDQDEITGFREKDFNHEGPSWVNAGVYAMQTRVLQTIPEHRPVSLEKELFPSLIGRGLYGYRSEREFIDIGTPESYAEASALFSQS